MSGASWVGWMVGEWDKLGRVDGGGVSQDGWRWWIVGEWGKPCGVEGCGKGASFG